MAVRTVSIRLPRIAQAVHQPLGPDFAPCSLDNHRAFRQAVRSEGPLVVVAMCVVAGWFWLAGRWAAWDPLAFAIIAVLLLVFILAVSVPLEIDVSPSSVRIRGIVRTRTIQLTDLASWMFVLSLKEAGDPTHERYFQSEIRTSSGKKVPVPRLCESVVVELTRRLPHPKLVFRVMSARRAVDLHPKEAT